MTRYTNWKDYVAALVRRRWWCALIAAPLAVGALALALLLPPVYVSETLILIQPRDVPEDIVRDLISVDSDRRLDSIRETVLSRTNLLSVYREFADALPELARLNMDDKLSQLRDSINIQFERPERRQPVLYFRISYRHGQPETAQQITRRLAELFIGYDSRTREQQVFGTGDFLRTEFDKVSTELARVDNDLAALKRQYQFELPEQLEANLRTLDRLAEERKANDEALDRYISHRLTLDRQISETPPTITESITATGTTRKRSEEVPPLVKTLNEKERAYQDLTTRYTDQHPDVRRAKAELERLRAEIPPEDLLEIEESKSGPLTRTVPNPVYQKLIAQLAEVKTEINIREREREQIERQINLYNSRVANTPKRELDIASRQREYDDLKKSYDQLNSKLSDARLAESLESRQKGEQFRIVDQASLPLVPSKPNRAMALLLGLGASLAIGLAAAFGRDILDQRFWTHAEAERFFGRPLLAEIPRILSPKAERSLKLRQRAVVALFVLTTVLSVAAVFAVYRLPGLNDWSAHKLAKFSTMF